MAGNLAVSGKRGVGGEDEGGVARREGVRSERVRGGRGEAWAGLGMAAATPDQAE